MEKLQSKGRRPSLTIIQKKRALRELDRAMKIAGIPSDAEGARQLHVKPENFAAWRSLRSPIGPAHVPKIASWGKGQIKKSVLRPDIFYDVKEEK